MCEHVRSEKLEMGPFPRLKWDNGDWEGVAVLPAWAGFRARVSAEGPRLSKRPTDGSVVLRVIGGPGEDVVPTAGQAAAFRYLMENQEEIKWVMLEALLLRYQEWRPDYKAFLGREFRELMPKVVAESGFRELIELTCVHVLRKEKDGMAYCGLQFWTSWETEHGLGFKMLGKELLEIGGAEAACS